MNSSIGSIPCPLCAEDSGVKKFARGRREGQLYVHCPKHGPFMNPGQDMQEWILNNAKMHGPGGVPVPAAAVEPAPDVELMAVDESAQDLAPAAAPQVSPPPVPDNKPARIGLFPLLGL